MEEVAGEEARFKRHPFVMGRCDACGKESEKRMMCGKCKLSSYCSGECQKRVWGHHKNTAVKMKYCTEK